MLDPKSAYSRADWISPVDCGYAYAQQGSRKYLLNGTEHKQALPSGYELGGYRLLDVLGVGGFGVTYLARHGTLGHRVAIKEYLPNEFAVRDGTIVHPKSVADREDFEWGLVRFLDEAKTLARFEHRNLVRVRDYFEANRTAYIVMDYEEGEPLSRLLESHGTLTDAQLRRILLPIVEGLREVHAAGYLHRDIKPSNVFVRRSDESPVLLDFGAARQALGRKSKSLTAVASAGYSPPEQYESEGEQGPWTDIYALSALCYRAIAGQSPIEAPRRMNRLVQGQPDPLPKLVETVREGYTRSFLEAVDRGLDVIAAKRPPNLDDWVARLGRVSTTGVGRVAPVRREAAESDGGARRSKAWAVAAGVAALGVIGALAAWIALEGKMPSLAGGTAPARPEVSAAPSPPAEPAARDAAAVGGRAILVVETEPEGVEVLVGGTVLGETPLERTDIRAGVREVTLRHPRYETVTLSDRTFADGEVLRIERTLLPGVGKLTLGAAEHRSIRVRAEVPKDGVALLERTLELIELALEPQPFTVAVTPAGAAVRFVDVERDYRDGVPLDPGEYRVRVSAPEYETVEVAVSHGSAPTRHEVVLTRVPQPFTIAVVPAGATIRFVNFAEDYLPGMRLAPGKYRIRLSAVGYEPREETVRHGAAPTRYEATLAPVLPAPGGTFTEELRSGGEGPQMIVLPAGSFRMGCLSNDDVCFDDEKPAHEVRIAAAFALSKHEATRREFSRFAAATGYLTSGSCTTYERGKWEDRSGWDWRNPGFQQTDTHPVVCVSWRDAVAYVAWLSRETGQEYRLPSEAEWEYAARAGSAAWWYFGNDASELCRYGNHADSSTSISWRNEDCSDGVGARTASVGAYGANRFGLYDMHGNVWEWVRDCWNGSYAGAPSEGEAWELGDCGKRVLRGGSWFDYPAALRAANRYGNSTGSRGYNGGFRVARTLIP